MPTFEAAAIHSWVDKSIVRTCHTLVMAVRVTGARQPLHKSITPAFN